ncbi:MAG: S-methyl-5'-thioadenosine phosphorylase [Chloroflexi bacterium]|nr:S-methyl-5'-thioadenosine phosphorylase [Chloroflexota bacterium]
MPQAKIGVIGGSGLYDLETLHEVEQVRVETPFGPPSDAITIGALNGTPIAFLPRHGRGHRILPTELSVRANIWALKSLGVEWVISVSAVGSLREELRPLDLVVPDQLIDRTRNRVNTFFGEGMVAHISFADPFCPVLREVLLQGAQEMGAVAHRGGTMIVMEGPAFSTRAESTLYRSWGADVIGMTALPEAKLAREAELCYATLACVTDYDVWHETEEDVTVEMVIGNLLQNVATAKAILQAVADRIPDERPCPCPTALANAIVTSRDAIPPETRQRLALLVDKYLS